MSFIDKAKKGIQKGVKKGHEGASKKTYRDEQSEKLAKNVVKYSRWIRDEADKLKRLAELTLRGDGTEQGTFTNLDSWCKDLEKHIKRTRDGYARCSYAHREAFHKNAGHHHHTIWRSLDLCLHSLLTFRGYSAAKKKIAHGASAQAVTSYRKVIHVLDELWARVR